MALQNFPNKIKVHLGSLWQAPGGGVGNRLERFAGGPEKTVAGGDTNTLILTKVSGQDVWTEDGTTVANVSSNRLSLEPNVSVGSFARVLIFGATTGGSFSAGRIIAKADGFTAITTNWYSFKRLWSIGSPVSATVGFSTYNFQGGQTTFGTAPMPSWNGGGSIYAVGEPSGPYAIGFYRQTFELMEEFVEPTRGADKTTYRHG